MTSARQAARSIRHELTGNPFVTLPVQWGVVHAVHTSPNTVDMYLDGSTVLTPGIRYLDGYSPTVGDSGIPVLRQGSDRFALGKLA